ncbi:hypothetical protein CTI12_AA068480 [Artemisia annua]|uniref:Uncharacterized protein n=1 Tax=Artemisia annua TaxID=35608 RepID=A0A2U1Q6J3_ARTAN|nr:hypothetical protein CTI12_AA068480 [Artemisia annua]
MINHSYHISLVLGLGIAVTSVAALMVVLMVFLIQRKIRELDGHDMTSDKTSMKAISHPTKKFQEVPSKVDCIKGVAFNLGPDSDNDHLASCKGNPTTNDLLMLLLRKFYQFITLSIFELLLIWHKAGGPNKTVLRRWSSGMGESQVSLINPNNVALEAESDIHFMESQISDSNAENIKPHSPEPEPWGVKGDTLQTEKEESCEKHRASIEWNQQKE